jgi:hypothetical protein
MVDEGRCRTQYGARLASENSSVSDTARRVHDRQAAGADHVCIQVITPGMHQLPHEAGGSSPKPSTSHEPAHPVGNRHARPPRPFGMRESGQGS